MKIHFPTFWPNTSATDHASSMLALGDLLPNIGTTTFACFDEHDLPRKGETVRLLWAPPVSDINGWDEQPSEMALSYLLTAEIVSKAALALPSPRDPGFILRGKYRYALKVLAHERLLTALKALEMNADSWNLPTSLNDRGIIQLWDEISWCGMATVEGLVYLTATARGETHIELLLEKEDEDLIGLLSMYSNPSGADCNLGRRRLTPTEQRAVRRAMDKAHPLTDSQAPYIVVRGS